jgi:hypothetical protein
MFVGWLAYYVSEEEAEGRYEVRDEIGGIGVYGMDSKACCRLID